MQHNITTVNFAISGGLAEGEIYTIAVHTLAGKDRDVDLVVGGRYLDKYEKRTTHGISASGQSSPTGHA
jgi:hypothetical protein